MSKAAVRLCVFVAFLLALSACSGTSPDQSGSTPTPAVNAAPPPTEDTGAVEQPLPPQEGQPGIPVPSLPIGGSDTTGGPCVQVSWSGPDIPQGYGAQVDGASFEDGAYQQTDGGCDGPPCIGHIFRASERQCDLAITPTDASATGRSESDQVSVSMDGHVLCPDYGAADCKSFEKSVRDQSPSMTVPRPIPPEAPQGSNGSDSTSSPTNSESTGG